MLLIYYLLLHKFLISQTFSSGHNQDWKHDTHSARQYNTSKEYQHIYTPEFEQPTQLDILLNRPATDESTQIAHSWNPKDSSQNIFLKQNNLLTFHRRPTPRTTDCVRGRKGYTQGLHAWQLVWPCANRGTHAVVGVATKDAPLFSHGYMPLVGTNQESWGWELVENKLYHNEVNYKSGGVTYPSTLAPGENFVVADSFLVILDMNEGTLSYGMKNKVNRTLNTNSSIPPTSKYLAIYNFDALHGYSN